jgi:cytochrome c oxidase subunit III
VSVRSTIPWGTVVITAEPRMSARTARLGMSLALAGIGMLFTAFTSALVVRHGLDPAWQAIPMPRVLLPNTLVLLASSICLEKARRAAGFGWLWTTLLLGGLFVAGQLVAWGELRDRGIYFASNAHSSFFYLLTAVHGAHLAGGLLALCFAALIGSARRARWLEVAGMYWHFMGGLWLYLLFLLFGLR